jgi:hypothetical protein
MTQAQEFSESQVMALAMFKDEIPCLLHFADPSCDELAKWVIVYTHEETVDDCEGIMPAPVCDTHSRQLQMAFSGFWRMWTNAPDGSNTCDRCGKPIRIDRVEPL